VKKVPLKQKVLSENDRIAGELRSRFSENSVLTLNFISSPGSGKTSLLERTLEHESFDFSALVLTGDIETDNDARRLAKFAEARQITTSGACHLDARMVENGLEGVDLQALDVLFIENVGNLVCPSGFDLGENAKIVVLSTAEGDDKPSKYPNIFVRAELMVINKIDLLPHVAFEVVVAEENARRVNPKIEIVKTSCTTGDGVENWLHWLRSRIQTVRSKPFE
jgi:hydrogenase nickel incorporation protein HypB